MDFLAILLLLFVVVGAICGPVALSRQSNVSARLDRIEKQLAFIRRRLGRKLTGTEDDQGRDQMDEEPSEPEETPAEDEPDEDEHIQAPGQPMYPPASDAPADEPVAVAVTPATPPPTPSPAAGPMGPAAVGGGDARDQQAPPVALPASPPEAPVAASSDQAVSDLPVTPAAEPEQPGAAQIPYSLPIAIPADEPRVLREESEAHSSDWWREFEDRVGKRWMTWVGVLALVIGALFFLQYAVRQGWIVPQLRVGAAVLTGVALLVIGRHFLRNQMRALGQGLVGGGLAVLYGAFYAAFAMYELLPQPVCFGAMVVVSAVGLTMAVRHDALPISFIAVLGGFITPMILRTGTDSRDLLFLYLLVLDLTVLTVAFFRQWPALLTLSFVGTTALFLTWFGAYYTPAAMTPTLLWLGAFYLAFLLMPFAQHFARRKPLDAEQFAAAHVSAVCAFLMAYHILWPDHPHCLGFIAMGMGALYAVLGGFSRLLVCDDRKSLFGFTLLAVSLVTLSIPMHFGLNGVTVTWAFEGPALVALGWIFRYRPLRVGGFIVLGIAVLRVLFYHWPLHSASFALFLNPTFAVVMLVPLAAAVCAVLRRFGSDEQSDVDDALALVAVLVAGVMGTALVHAESHLWITLSSGIAPPVMGYWSFSFGALIWAVGAAGFLFLGSGLKHDFGRAVGLIMLTLGAFLAACAYGNTAPYEIAIFLNARFACAAPVVAVAFLYAFSRARRGQEDAVSSGILAGYMAPLLVIIEMHAWPRWGVNFDSCAMGWWKFSLDALTLSVAGAAFTVIGFLRRVSAFRTAALPLLGVGLLAACCAFCRTSPRDAWLFLNLRFLAAAALVGSLFGVAWVRRRLGEQFVTGIAIFAGLLATLFVDLELREWIERSGVALFSFQAYWQRSADAFVWAVGAAAFLWAGVFGRNGVSRGIALAALGVSVLCAAGAYAAASPDSALLFVNPRFIAGAAALTVAFVAAGLRRRMGEAGSAHVAVLAGILTIVLVDIELREWLVRSGVIDQTYRDYWLLSTDAILWAVGAGVFLTVAAMLRSAAGRATSVAVAAVAGVLWLWACTVSSPPQLLVFINARFLGAALVLAFLAAYAEIHRRLGEGTPAAAAGIGAGYLAMVMSDVEMSLWIGAQPVTSWVRTGYYFFLAHLLAAAAGAVGFLVAGWRLRSRVAFMAGLLPLVIACVLALFVYGYASPRDAMLLLNARFVLALVCAVSLFLYATAFRRREEERELGLALFWCAVPFLLVLLSVEDYQFWTRRAGLDPRQAGWAAQMSLSVVWGLYAAALLAIGFWRRTRALRFAGLALFGVTAMKLAIIDIAHVHQIYRIISFVVLGVLMITASYLYHRIEKRLES